jgi:hypothetical protein
MPRSLGTPTGTEGSRNNHSVPGRLGCGAARADEGRGERQPFRMGHHPGGTQRSPAKGSCRRYTRRKSLKQQPPRSGPDTDSLARRKRRRCGGASGVANRSGRRRGRRRWRPNSAWSRCTAFEAVPTRARSVNEPVEPRPPIAATTGRGQLFSRIRGQNRSDVLKFLQALLRADLIDRSPSDTTNARSTWSKLSKRSQNQMHGLRSKANTLLRNRSNEASTTGNKRARVRSQPGKPSKRSHGYIDWVKFGDCGRRKGGPIATEENRSNEPIRNMEKIGGMPGSR